MVPLLGGALREHTLTLRSDDGGDTWTAGVTTRLPSAVTMGLTTANSDATILYLATRHMALSYGHKGGVFKSHDGGLTWKRVSMPKRWEDWASYSGACVLACNAAVALDPRREHAGDPPPGVPGVLLTRDAGRSWQPLKIGMALPHDGWIDLLGFADRNTLFAFVHAGPDSDGRLVV